MLLLTVGTFVVSCQIVLADPTSGGPLEPSGAYGNTTVSPRPIATSPITVAPAVLQFANRGSGSEQEVQVTDSLPDTSIGESDNCSWIAHVGVTPIITGVLFISVSPTLSGYCEITVTDTRNNSRVIPVIISGIHTEGMQFLTTANFPKTMMWGPLSDDLRLSLNADTTGVQVGEPTLVTLDLENLGPDRGLSLGCNMREWYDIRIENWRGRTIPHRPVGSVACYELSTSSVLRQFAVMELTVRLDRDYDMTEAGSYTLTATSVLHLPGRGVVDDKGNRTFEYPILATLTSNPVSINVRAAASPDDRASKSKSPAATTNAQDTSTDCNIVSSPFTISFGRDQDLDRQEHAQMKLEFYLKNASNLNVKSIDGLASMSARGISRSASVESYKQIPARSFDILEADIGFDGDGAGLLAFRDEPLNDITYKWTTTSIELDDGTSMKCSL